MTKKDTISHCLVPKHKKLSEKEKKDLLDRYNITEKELPSIKKKDPALRGMELEIGDVVKVERASLTAGRTTYYRCVIN